MGLRIARGDPGLSGYVADCVRRLPAVARPERNAIHGPPLTAIWLSLATSQRPVRSAREVSSFASRQRLSADTRESGR